MVQPIEMAEAFSRAEHGLWSGQRSPSRIQTWRCGLLRRKSRPLIRNRNRARRGHRPRLRRRHQGRLDRVEVSLMMGQGVCAEWSARVQHKMVRRKWDLRVWSSWGAMERG